MKYHLLEGGVYYLNYRGGEGDLRRTYLGVKYPGGRATPLVVLGGKRAKDVYEFILQVLDNCGLKCREVEKNGEKLIKLPWATGLVASFFLLSVYSIKKPLKYAFAFEKMIAGEMPLSRYSILLLNLAVDLSRHFESKGEYGVSHPRQMIGSKAAKIVSRMTLHFLESIAPA